MTGEGVFLEEVAFEQRLFGVWLSSFSTHSEQAYLVILS